MPIDNAFRHQHYTDQQPRVSYRFERPGGSTDGLSDERSFGQRLHAAGVQRVVLAHGTFTGNDALGLARGLERVIPRAAAPMRQLGHDFVDHLARDVGNFSDVFVDRFRDLLRPHGSAIDVRRFVWSGENHHLGRADAAIRLVDQMLAAVEEDCRHCLLWGHSHAGNVFALVTNLLAGPPTAVRRFFRAGRPLFESSSVSPTDRERWQRVGHLLLHRRERAEMLRLDIVTFGTPIRYGWETRGYQKLLHWIHHRPATGLPDYLAPFPFTWDDVRTARHGDYIQQVGIAGTDFFPSFVSWRAWRSEKRLARLLKAGMRCRGTLRRLSKGTRVAEDGTTMLIDYPSDNDNLRAQLLGHGIYTSIDWLPYHLSHVVRRFYTLGD